MLIVKTPKWSKSGPKRIFCRPQHPTETFDFKHNASLQGVQSKNYEKIKKNKKKVFFVKFLLNLKHYFSC